MKRMTTKWMFAAAALVVVAGSASAQNLKADIPFTFRAGDKLMTSGTYTVSTIRTNNRPYIRLQNNDTRASTLLAQYVYVDPSNATKAAGVARLQFLCAASQCVLRELWEGAGSTSAYQFQGPKLGREDLRMAEIPMTRVKAD